MIVRALYMMKTRSCTLVDGVRKLIEMTKGEMENRWLIIDKRQGYLRLCSIDY